MKRLILIYVPILIFAFVMTPGCKNNPNPGKPATVELTGDQLVQRGEYLVTIMGCNDCHSPKQNSPQGPVVIPELMLSGYPGDRPYQKPDPEVIKKGWVLFNEDFTSAAGPWGVSFAANLTSDQTGIGNWAEENFKRALKEGKFKGLEGTRMLLPPMPWFNFKNIADEDVSAIFAYLKSTNPVKNVVPEPISPEGSM
jgi:hypothetical protein